MKTLILLLITLSLFAQTSSIDEQIAQLQSADSQTRYKLMNEIKMRISSMNAAERSAAISTLQKSKQKSTIQQDTQQTHHSANQMQQLNQQHRAQEVSKASQGQHQQPHQGNGNGYGK